MVVYKRTISNGTKLHLPLFCTPFFKPLLPKALNTASPRESNGLNIAY